MELTPFNGDACLHGEVGRLIGKLSVRCAVETGTYHGHTTIALSALCDRVVTIEIDSENADKARSLFGEFAGSGTIELMQESSERAIASIANSLRGTRALFFLDAHGRDYWPLRDELAVISQIDGPKPVIVIHDCEVPGRPDLGFDRYKRTKLNFAYVRESLERVYAGGFLHHYNHVAVGARRGVLFVEPSC